MREANGLKNILPSAMGLAVAVVGAAWIWASGTGRLGVTAEGADTAAVLAVPAGLALGWLFRRWQPWVEKDLGD